MKVALVLDTTLDSDAGVQQYFKGLGRFLLGEGHDIRFIVPPSKDIGEFKGKILTFGKNIDPLGNVTSVPISFQIGGGNEINKMLERERFDIVHASAPMSPFMGAKVVSRSKCPVVITYHTHMQRVLYRLGARFLRFLLWGAIKNIDTFIAVSDIAKKEARHVIPGNYRVITNAVDIHAFSPQNKPLSKFSDGKKNILFLGRLEERKGAEYAIRAFEIVKKEVPNSRLIIVSDGPLRSQLELLVEELELQDVVFEGYIDEKLKPNYYASADICVFPALFGESFGIVLIEAMATGKVTIGYDNEGYAFVLRNIPKLLVQRKDVEGLSKKVVEFLNDDKLKKEYEQKCLHEAKRYSWQHVGKQILDVYKDLQKNRQ